VPLSKFGALLHYAPALAYGAGLANSDAGVGLSQMGDLVTHKTLDLQRRARAFGTKAALDMAVAQSGLNKEKYSAIIASVDAILEFGKAEVAEGDIEFKNYFNCRFVINLSRLC
jgi:hypothetical protein